MISTQGARARFSAVKEQAGRTPRKFDPPRDESGRRLKVSEFFGMNTFDQRLMREKLPKDVFAKLLTTIETGGRLDPGIAGTVAHAFKEWAISRGVTHFTHWFQPQTGATAEKHEAFLAFDEQRSPVEKFSGQQLIQGEPDASSFPSGGMRTTFEARGYTAWDPSSPVFIMETASCKTLCIPSVFLSHHGHALDEKTGFLRSVEVLSEKLCALLELSGTRGARRVVPMLGVEQEYFLIDRAFHMLRPDLIMTGRSLLGGQPPKGQQLEDHYFGSIAARVQSFMSEMEHELFKLGVPAKARHNEVAPSQYECAPIYGEANISIDHNQVMMEVIRKTAIRHNFAALMHEKPFAGVNGSGKHCNWSLAITASGQDLDGENLLDPGTTPGENLRFLLVLAGVLKGVHKHAGLLRAGVASAGNDHRLGANEAPPAILSVFLGDMLSKILDEIEKGAASGQNPEAAVIKLGVSRLPEVMRDNTDRNRTSPFAFTGNKFEFRAVGSSASPAFPVMLLNAAVADGVEEVAALVKKHLAAGKSVPEAAIETVRAVSTGTRPVRFEGNNYSEEWVQEAGRRGLPNLRKTPEALAQMTVPSSVEMLTRLGIFSELEVHSRYHVRLERYIKNMMIEVDTMKSMLDTMVLPAACSYHATLAWGAASAKTAGMNSPAVHVADRVSALAAALQAARTKLDAAARKAEAAGDEAEKARLYSLDVATAMTEARTASDELESVVADDLWPLPKYREMLFLI